MNEQITKDALEYGAHIRAGGWRLGLLVARSVEKGRGQGTRKPRSDRSKVSIRDFAKIAGTSHPRVSRHLDAWEKAAEAGHVPAAATLVPGQEVELDVEKLPDWGDYYTAVSGGHDRFNGEPTTELVQSMIDKLPAKKRVTVAAETLDTEDVIEALKEDEKAQDHVYHATVTASDFGKGEKSTKPKRNTKLREMAVVFALIAALGEIRDLAKQDPRSPLIAECKALMRETLGILDGIEAASDPEEIDRMLDEFGELLASQQ